MKDRYLLRSLAMVCVLGLTTSGCIHLGDNSNSNNAPIDLPADEMIPDEEFDLIKSATEDGKPYGIKSGIVKYDTHYEDSTEHSTHYWRDWGNLMSIHLTGPDSNDLVIIDYKKGEIINADLNTKTGTKMQSEWIKTYFQDEGIKAFLGDIEATFETEADMDMEYELLGQEEILGYNADVYSVKEAGDVEYKVWLYKGVILKSETVNPSSDYESEYDEVATEFKPGLKVDDDKFKVPEDVIIEDMGDMEDYFGEMEEGLNELEEALSALEELENLDSLSELEEWANQFDS